MRAFPDAVADMRSCSPNLWKCVTQTAVIKVINQRIFIVNLTDVSCVKKETTPNSNNNIYTLSKSRTITFERICCHTGYETLSLE